MVLVIILLGPPGSGKGTQALLLSKELKLPHISTGDLFRDNISRNTPLGQKAKAHLDAGKLCPDDLVIDMLFDRVSQPDCAQGYLLDGFPRTIPQSEALDKHLKANTRVIALNLLVRDESIVKRIEGRLTCRNCGSVYNLHFSPPTKKGICDKCGGELYQRTDDSAAVVQERLKVYHKQTAPLVEYYTKKKVLINVNGDASPEIVFQNLRSALQDGR